MTPRLSRTFFAFFISFSCPVVAAASDNVENFPVSTWTLSGTVSIEGASAEPRAERMWRVRFDQSMPAPWSPKTSFGAQDAAAQARPKAFEYSDAYNTRRKIHMIASFATLPLFVGQYITGNKLYDGDASSSVKSAHGVFAGGIAALFAVNTVTGVWNLMEARHDPNGRTRRLVHGLLMLGADAGFVATGLMAPDDDNGSDSGKAAHRNVAIASMGVAAASYVYMLVTR